MKWNDDLVFSSMNKALDELILVTKYRSLLAKKSPEVDQAVLFKLSLLLAIFMNYVSQNKEASACTCSQDIFTTLVAQGILHQTDTTLFNNVVIAHRFFFESDVDPEKWHTRGLPLKDEQSFEMSILENIPDFGVFFENFMVRLSVGGLLEEGEEDEHNAHA